ncbi:DUF6355 family natural product biosynthesis protein [Saccharothrix lopnurensis]|uniref:DUF6355 family natural product biosynthesis protein n=1 Tax=Saccharothrix lopnurensis TaxID=1670621 RepID=A0ABW1P2Z1_9PSEU
MKNSVKVILVGLFAILGALLPNVGAGAATAAPAAIAASVAAQAQEEIPCGYFENAEAAYYGHCGDTTVMIKVDYHHGRPSMYTCVGPWTLTYLGSDDDVSNAFYVGLC